METHSSTKLRNDDCGCKDTIFFGFRGLQEKRIFRIFAMESTMYKAHMKIHV